METGIFYFSATGNSLAAAKAIAAHFDCPNVINIAEAVCGDRIFAGYDRVIAVYPSYAYGTPVAVRRFFQRAEIKKGGYVAALVTYGSKQGGALAEAKRLLRRRGIKLNYAGRIPAVENFIPMFGAPKKKKLIARTAMQEQAVKTICAEIESGKKRGVCAFRVLPKIVSAVFRAARPLIVKFYRVEKSCTGCGICERVCPVRAVKIINGKPKFSGKCEICQCCVNWCPQKSVSFLRVKPETPRYTNANVTLSEFIMKGNQADAEQEEFAQEEFAGEAAAIT